MTAATSARRVLFVHARKDRAEVAMPHLGMGILTALLRQAGHEVTVLDEALYPFESMPVLREVIAEVQPDVIGFSVYTSTRDRTLALLREAREISPAPIMVGGPHVTLFGEEMAALECVDYAVCGEAENVIVDLVATAERQPAAQVIEGTPADVAALPWPDYSATIGHSEIDVYPVVTSRGCPYRCSFCAVHRILTHRWRPRDPADCVAEVRAAVLQFPRLRILNVSDDCPTAKVEHFKQFLRLLADEHLPLILDVNNLRADSVDTELVDLLKKAGADKLCFGVESGNPAVFAMVNKGETLDDIVRAAELVKQGGLTLGACFVIGLPGDTYERHLDSVRLARRLKPTLIYWNMAHPFPGTAVHSWFLEHGAEIDAPRSYTSYDTHSLSCPEPTVGTAEFSKWERQKAYFLAVVETDQYVIGPRFPWRELAGGAIRYRLYGPALRSLARRVMAVGFRRLRRWIIWMWQRLIFGGGRRLRWLLRHFGFTRA